jgi:hypothetical protein
MICATNSDPWLSTTNKAKQLYTRSSATDHLVLAPAYFTLRSYMQLYCATFPNLCCVWLISTVHGLIYLNRQEGLPLYLSLHWSISPLNQITVTLTTGPIGSASHCFQTILAMATRVWLIHLRQWHNINLNTVQIAVPVSQRTQFVNITKTNEQCSVSVFITHPLTQNYMQDDTPPFQRKIRNYNVNRN